MVRSGEFIQFLLFLGGISVVVSIIIMLWPPPRSKRINRRTDEPPTGDISHPAQKLHPQDRPIHHESRIFPWVPTVILLVLVGGAIFYYIWQKQTYSHVYRQLGIAPLSALVEIQPRIQSRLNQLSREPCYQEAIIGISDALLDVGYPRESAVSLLSFAKNCGGPSRDVLERAYHSLKKVNDFSGSFGG